MTAPTPSVSALPLDRIDLDVLQASRMERPHGSSTVPFLLETTTGPYVLKIPKAPRGLLKTTLRRWIGSPAFAWQVAVGEALDQRTFEAFRYPRIVQTDASTYCVFEFVTGRHAYDLGDADRKRFLDGLLEFQLSGIELLREGLGARMLGAISRQGATVSRRSVALASHLGPRVAARCLRAVAWCRGHQPPLPEPILLHNDLHPENVILGPERIPHVMDFEGVTLERRWVLVDIVHFAMATGRFAIDTDVIRDYLVRLRCLRPAWRLDLAAQLRFALLKRTLDHLGSTASPLDVREAYRAFLVEVVLDDTALAAWMARNALTTAWPTTDAHAPAASVPPPPPPPLLALFVPELSGGGSERVALELARGFVGRGFRADLVVLRPEGALGEQIPDGVRMVELDPDRARSSVPALAGYLRRERPAALLSSAEHGSIAALAARTLSRENTRTVIAVHTTVSAKWKGAVGIKRRLTPVLFAAAVRAADRIVAVSDGAADDLASFARIRRSRIDTIHNPVDVCEIRARGAETPDHPWLATGTPLIVSVGRLSVEKDHETLMRAFALLPDANHARLLILGEGPERVRLEALASELGMDDRVRLPGFVDNPHAFVARADVFVLGSRREALPMALAEALALGVPIVSTDCVSGPRAMLRDGAYGRLVPVGDPRAMATAIRQTLEHPIAYDRDEAARPFAFDAAVDAYLRVAGVSAPSGAQAHA